MIARQFSQRTQIQNPARIIPRDQQYRQVGQLGNAQKTAFPVIDPRPCALRGDSQHDLGRVAQPRGKLLDHAERRQTIGWHTTGSAQKQRQRPEKCAVLDHVIERHAERERGAQGQRPVPVRGMGGGDRDEARQIGQRTGHPPPGKTQQRAPQPAGKTIARSRNPPGSGRNDRIACPCHHWLPGPPGGICRISTRVGSPLRSRYAKVVSAEKRLYQIAA